MSTTLAELLSPSRLAELPAVLYSRVATTPLPKPHPLAFNPAAQQLLGLDLGPGDISLLAGNTVPEQLTPLATAYAGHQFGVLVPQLGDGRAITLGEVEGADGQRWEVQLKGAGPTPYSRFADGRAVLRSSIREYLVSEAMAALGIPTTRALALIGSDEPVQRETVETTAVLTRIAPSHLRFGHFEFLYYRQRWQDLALLADFVIRNHYPELLELPPAERYPQWLRAISQRSAEMVARWQGVGFCHGVLNSDNMSILGLTLDYGPYGFMDAFDFGHICNHTDAEGRYAYHRQPSVVHWNMGRLAQALVPILAAEPQAGVEVGNALLGEFPAQFEAAWLRESRAKLGLQQARDGDDALMQGFLELLQQQHADFTRSFRALATVGRSKGDAELRREVGACQALDIWLQEYRRRLQAEPRDDAHRHAAMQQRNPKYVLRNHLAQRAIEQAQQGDYAEIMRLQKLLQQPFAEQPGQAAYAALPPQWAAQLSVSCSS